jgi:hypothetical protein
MPVKEFLGDRRRNQEEEYFQRQEQQLVARLQQQNREAADRERMAERLGVSDPEVLRDLQTLGFTSDTVGLLHLIPLLEVAWAEQGVSESERGLILAAARAHGIDEGSPADHQLATWVTTRPSPAFFATCLRAIGELLRSRPSDEQDASRRNLLSESLAIASASGGILGLGKVSNEERQVLARLTAELERARDRAPGAGGRS